MEKTDLKLIIKNVKAMLFHRIGDYCINGTDNLIISSFINIATVGVYANYLAIISILNTFTFMIYANLNASIGNFIITENNERKVEIFNKINFIGFLIFGYCSVILFSIFNDFISAWLGNQYCLEVIIVNCIIFNFYITGMRVPVSTVKTAAGLYDIDKYTPLLQSAINLFVSIVLVKKIGLLGVILGTIISGIAIPIWQRPYIVYKHVLKRNFKEYMVKYIQYLVVLISIVLMLFVINRGIIITNIYLKILIKVIISTVMFLSTVWLIYRNTEEIKYILDMPKKVLCRRKNEQRVS